MSFVIPIHAVDLELEKPDRFYVQDVWEVADEPTEDVVAGLEGADFAMVVFGSNCHFELWLRFGPWSPRVFQRLPVVPHRTRRKAAGIANCMGKHLHQCRV